MSPIEYVFRFLEIHSEKNLSLTQHLHSLPAYKE